MLVCRRVSSLSSLLTCFPVIKGSLGNLEPSYPCKALLSAGLMLLCWDHTEVCSPKQEQKQQSPIYMVRWEWCLINLALNLFLSNWGVWKLMCSMPILVSSEKLPLEITSPVYGNRLPKPRSQNELIAWKSSSLGHKTGVAILTCLWEALWIRKSYPHAKYSP